MFFVFFLSFSATFSTFSAILAICACSASSTCLFLDNYTFCSYPFFCPLICMEIQLSSFFNSQLHIQVFFRHFQRTSMILTTSEISVIPPHRKQESARKHWKTTILAVSATSKVSAMSTMQCRNLFLIHAIQLEFTIGLIEQMIWGNNLQFSLIYIWLSQLEIGKN